MLGAPAGASHGRLIVRTSAIYLLAGNGISLIVSSCVWGLPAFVGGFSLLALAAWITERNRC